MLDGNYKNQWDKNGADGNKGSEAETQFATMFAQKYGWERIKPTTTKEDKKHIDFWILGADGKWHSVDVKVAKFDEYGNYCVWVEYIAEGRFGWIYGVQEYMAFEKPRKDGFVCVRTDKLREWCQTNIQLDFVDTKDEAWYKVYIRKKPDNSMDCVGLIGYKDIEQLKEWEL